MRPRTTDTLTRDAANGFTLIELLVALSVLGLAAAMLLAGLGTAGSLVTVGGQRTAQVTEIETVQTIIRQRIETLMPITRIGGFVNEVDFQGDAHSVTFDGPPVQSVGAGALVRYRLARSAQGDLVLYSASMLADGIDREGNDLKGWRAQVLLHHVDAMAISFYGSQPTAVSGGWQSFWKARPQPPEAVRITLSFTRGDPRIWPTFVARLYANANAVCRLDDLTGRCEVDP